MPSGLPAIGLKTAEDTSYVIIGCLKDSVAECPAPPGIEWAALSSLLTGPTTEDRIVVQVVIAQVTRALPTSRTVTPVETTEAWLSVSSTID
jgi:hypothetical protein